MNKFNFFIFAMVVFGAVAQLASAEELVNEIQDDTDVDDELEGGFFHTNARNGVGLNSNDEWGWDVLDKNKGIKDLNSKRTPDCKRAKKEATCKTCCEDLDKSYHFQILKTMTPNGGCTCFSRDNAYSTQLV